MVPRLVLQLCCVPMGQDTITLSGLGPLKAGAPSLLPANHTGAYLRAMQE